MALSLDPRSSLAHSSTLLHAGQAELSVAASAVHTDRVPCICKLLHLILRDIVIVMLRMIHHCSLVEDFRYVGSCAVI